MTTLDDQALVRVTGGASAPVMPLPGGVLPLDREQVAALRAKLSRVVHRLFGKQA